MKDLIKFEYLKLDELTPYERNTRSHDRRSIDSIKSSINETGMNDPIGVWGDKNIIVEGHGRYLACRELGIEIVPVLHLDYLTDEERRKYAIAHNRTTELSEFNQYLKLELDELNFECPDLHFEEIDFKNDNSFDNNINIVEDEAPEVDEENEPITKKGDIWQLGNHRLMCGDSTDKATVEKLMNGAKADLVFTDPPYGVSASGGRSQTKDKLGMKAIINDELRNNELTQFLSDFISAMQYKEGASIYICYPWATQKEFTEAIQMNGLKIKNCIIWDKKVFGLNGFKGYRPQYEMIYFCCKDDFEWYGDKAQSNIWQISREINREEQGNHPTPKPIELIAKALNNSSKQEDIVLDVFGGSGSTLIACEQLNRKCYMMEIDPKYCDVILKRYINLKGSSEDVYRLNADGTKTKYSELN